jgi:D-alanyl-D-alanine carboxypeptidase
MLAGLVIERVTGHRLGRELERRIFAPLHLRHTSFPTDDTTIEGHHAKGHALVNGKLLDVTVLNPSGHWGAGNLVSNTADIARFWRTLLGGKLLRPAQLKAMKTTVPAWKGSHLRYGLGIMPVPSACGTLWGNGGDVAGYSNNFRSSPDGKRQVGLAVNINPAPEGLDEARDVAQNAAIADALGPC